MFPPPRSQSLRPPCYATRMHTRTHHNNLYGSLDLLAIQELPGPPPFHALLQSPTSGVGQSPEVPGERFRLAPQQEKSRSVTSWNPRRDKDDQTPIGGDPEIPSMKTNC